MKLFGSVEEEKKDQRIGKILSYKSLLKMNDDLLPYSPYYLRKNKAMNIGFILRVLFASKFRTEERRIVYFLFGAGIIDLKAVSSEYYTSDVLLDIMFNLTQHKKLFWKKDLYQLTGLSKDTFNKYFHKQLIKLGFVNRKKFSYQEVYSILKVWQGDGRWGRMKAFSKRELTNLFTNGSYEDLELNVTNELMSYEDYKCQDKFAPNEVKEIVKSILEENEVEEFYRKNFNKYYLTLVFYMFLGHCVEQMFK